MKAVKAVSQTEQVSIKAINLKHLAFKIVGIAPYVQHKFSAKAIQQIMATQSLGQQAKSKRVREPKDFDAVYENAIHRTKEGWYGIPAPAFRNACISACRTVGFKMTVAKLSIFVEPDGFDQDDGTPLVRIHGEPRKHVMQARNDNGGIDIRVRPLWNEGWKATVRVTYDADQFSSSDVANLLKRAGRQVGVGEGRPDSRMSAGLGWGLFDLESEG